MRNCSLLLASLLVWLLPALSLGEASREVFPDEKAIEFINDATFEVVTPKPAKDSLTYEKPLPLDLIPYAIRKDSYYSIGTAFAIGPDRLVSASHVMNMGMESQFKEVLLRDRSGKIYAIDKISKFADNRDFIVFSLKGKRVEHPFEVNVHPQMNQRVYAVGNALGQGIVVRDGLLTSVTPEEENGEWQWLRFSAAASPGNSGGPLLDRTGKVIGIILRKSENENLNYALPVGEVLGAKENVAVSHDKAHYTIDNMDMSKTRVFDKEYTLPKSYDELNRELIANYATISATLLREFLAENRDAIFPNGSGSLPLLNDISSNIFPTIIKKADDGNWKSFYPSDKRRAELGNNGYIIHGGIINSMFLNLQTPDDIKTADLYRDSKLFMDLILKGVYFYREIGGEKIKVVSLGKAQEEYTFVDAWKRKWLVRSWLLEYDDEKVVTFSLPVPGGCISIVKTGQTGLVDVGKIPDLKVLADFVHLSYYGTFEQWQEFLQQKELLPDAFSSIDLTFDYGGKFTYKSKRLSFSSTPEIMTIAKTSDLQLLFGFFRDGDKVVWDVEGVVVGEDKNTSTNFNIVRETRPPRELNDAYRSDWENMVKQKFPYNRSSFFNEGTTIIKMARPMEGMSPEDTPFFYNISYKKLGNGEQKEMEATLDKIAGSVRILEKGEKASTPLEGKLGGKGF